MSGTGWEPPSGFVVASESRMGADGASKDGSTGVGGVLFINEVEVSRELVYAIQ